MSKTELRPYFLNHCTDQAASQADLARINQRPPRIIASPNDPDFEAKIQAAIRHRSTIALTQTESLSC